ncbi:hypothetical protein BR10RB9215_C12145 [Brucella sp. 10RB9215]|uniref:helix-turn-helix transcriptional regulator n=1 Tax=Brucella sp. 10RB9215 TaxID=1149953 RepID=UPI00090AAA68|nr:helix-turn-helix transcriptional regulator [Brucella sp. 10RB9215]SBW15294.1 hypothetical protein BR10RB9215_C12145 [Brucella sp. 10RB9215]
MADSKKWFLDRLKDKRLTQVKLAELLDMSPSTLSLLFAGKRKMRVEQAAEISRFLGVPLNDVMAHAGANVPAGGNGGGMHSIVGWVDDHGNATLDWSERGRKAELPGAYPPTAVCIQFRTTQGFYALWDGWLVVTLPPREPEPEQLLDRYCLVLVKGADKPILRQIRRGYSPNRYTLVDFVSDPIYDAELAWFSPILAIIPR